MEPHGHEYTIYFISELSLEVDKWVQAFISHYLIYCY